MGKFFSLTVKRPRTPIPCGQRVRVEHALRYDEYGNKYLAEVGSYDQYTYIQSFAASCDINEIIRRATPEQMEAFSKGMYADTTVMPKTLADSYALLRDVEHLFDSLPADVRAGYKSYNEFLNSFGTLSGAAEFVAKCTKKTAAENNSDTTQSTKKVGENNES